MKTLSSLQNVVDAVKLVHRYAPNFDLYRLAGPHNAPKRAEIMSLLMGRKVPAAKSGIHALESALFEFIPAEVRNHCTCLFDTRQQFALWAAKVIV